MACSTLSLVDWSAIFSSMAADVRQEILPLLGTDEAAIEIGSLGAGGDKTLEVDRRAEDVVMDRLAELARDGLCFSVLSEERGRIDHGAEYPLIIVDPVDGSTNAKRGGLGAVAVLFSLLDGPSVKEVCVGYTMDITTGAEWIAKRHAGMLHNGRHLKPMRRCGELYEVLCLHARHEDELARGWNVITHAAELRQLGCVALSLVHTADGGMDLFFSPRRARIFDLTAGILMIQEVGGVVTDLEGRSIDDLHVDLTTRTTLVCSAHKDVHHHAIQIACASD